MRVFVLSNFLCTISLCALLVTPAYAEEKQADKKNADEVVTKAVPAKEGTPVAKLDAATDALMKGLDENQLLQFGSIQSAHGTIRAVEDVQQSISRAVDSCSTHNPEMKETISHRFEVWKESVRPIMKQARSRLDKMILLQGFAQPSEIRAYLKKFDAAVIYRNQGINPVAVTAKSDCENLQKSMGKTQENLTKLLTETLNLNSDLKVKE